LSKSAGFSSAITSRRRDSAEIEPICGRVVQAQDPTLYTQVLGVEPEGPCPTRLRIMMALLARITSLGA
jgi:hypothetical protein